MRESVFLRRSLLPACALLTAGSLLAPLSAPVVCRAENLLERLFTRSELELRAVRAGRFVFAFDHELEAEQAGRLARGLEVLHERLQRDLHVPELSGDVRVYVFRSHRGFSHYIRRHIPYLGRSDMHRSGLFLLRNAVPHVFVVNDENLSASLRHEFVHVVLNSSAPGLPLWLDEGLAVYYETLDEPARREELARLLAKRHVLAWRPDLARLEQLDEMPDMDSLAYAEAWAWVRLLQEGPAEVRDLLPAYLRDFAEGRGAAPLSEQLRGRLRDPGAAWRTALR